MSTSECEAAAKTYAAATGLDFAFWLEIVTKYGRVLAEMFMEIINAWNAQPKAALAAPGTCSPELEAALKEACKRSCATCCAIHAAAHAAGCCCD